MSPQETSSVGVMSRDRPTLDHRIEALERGIRVWRCLTAVGFLTAMSAFALAVFGLGQLENAYFIGEVAVSAPASTPLQGVERDPGQAVAAAVWSPGEQDSHSGGCGQSRSAPAQAMTRRAPPSAEAR